jgi:hypothetical protein
MSTQRNHVLFSTKAFKAARSEQDHVALGGDVATMLAEHLERDGSVLPSAPFAEDWGWCIQAVRNDERHMIYVGLVDGSGPVEPRWLAWLEQQRTLGDRLLGRNRHVSSQMLQSLHKAIIALPGVKDLQWFTKTDFLAGSQDKWTPTPE